LRSNLLEDDNNILGELMNNNQREEPFDANQSKISYQESEEDPEVAYIN